MASETSEKKTWVVSWDGAYTYGSRSDVVLVIAVDEQTAMDEAMLEFGIDPADEVAGRVFIAPLDSFKQYKIETEHTLKFRQIEKPMIVTFADEAAASTKRRTAKRAR